MKVKQAGDLIFMTYHMVDWKSEPQANSRRACSECGREMRMIVAEVGDKRVTYEGLACHSCKRLTWVKRA